MKNLIARRIGRPLVVGLTATLAMAGCTASADQHVWERAIDSRESLADDLGLDDLGLMRVDCGTGVTLAHDDGPPRVLSIGCWETSTAYQRELLAEISDRIAREIAGVAPTGMCSAGTQIFSYLPIVCRNYVFDVEFPGLVIVVLIESDYDAYVQTELRDVNEAGALDLHEVLNPPPADAFVKIALFEPTTEWVIVGVNAE